MSAQPWRCRSCGARLGFVVQGTLKPDVRVEIDRTGKLRASCPNCGAERVWFPEREVSQAGR